ncbi:MAG: cupin domain-containing protein [Candidatus Woesearchaeota archaeon]
MMSGLVCDENNPSKIVDKPWGRELWLEVNPFYVLKILEVKKGCAFSLQYHREKHETWYFLEGSAEVVHGDSSIIATKGRIIVVPPHTIHRITAKEFTRFVEVSTPQLTDVVRLADDYGRPSEDLADSI